MSAITKGENSASISLTLELLNIVKRRAGIDQQINGFWICKRWLMFDEEVKKEIVDKYGQAFYDELLAHYSKTNIQQRAERELEREAKEIRRKAKEEAKAKIEQLKMADVRKHALERELRALELKGLRTKEDFAHRDEILLALGIRLARPQTIQPEPQQAQETQQPRP